MTTETVSDERLRELIAWLEDETVSPRTLVGDDYLSALRELQSLRAEVEALRRDAATRMVRAIGHLIQLPCACPYDPGKPGEGAQLMGQICRRCAAIHLLNGGELPDAAKGGDRG